MSTAEEAQNAIQQMHGSQTMPVSEHFIKIFRTKFIKNKK